MVITSVHPSEAEVLTEIAMTAKRHWGYPETWMRQWQTLLTVTPTMIVKNEVFAARDGSRIIGFAALRSDADLLWLCDLWVLPSEMGQGVGRRLFRHAQQRAQALGFTTLQIESDPHASGFYEQMGAVQIHTHVSQIEGQSRELPVYRCRTSVEAEPE